MPSWRRSRQCDHGQNLLQSAWDSRSTLMPRMRSWTNDVLAGVLREMGVQMYFFLGEVGPGKRWCRVPRPGSRSPPRSERRTPGRSRRHRGPLWPAGVPALSGPGREDPEVGLDGLLDIGVDLDDHLCPGRAGKPWTPDRGKPREWGKDRQQETVGREAAESSMMRDSFHGAGETLGLEASEPSTNWGGVISGRAPAIWPDLMEVGRVSIPASRRRTVRLLRETGPQEPAPSVAGCSTPIEEAGDDRAKWCAPALQADRRQRLEIAWMKS